MIPPAMRREILLALSVAALGTLTVLAWHRLRRATPRLPRHLASFIPPECQQVMLVLSPEAASQKARLWLLERSAFGGWTTHAGPLPATLGGKGLAWGAGEHRCPPPPGFPVKLEGDKCSPAGVFRIPFAFGIPPADQASHLRLPYTPLTEHTIGVDDVSSQHYNRIVDDREVLRDWISHEAMNRHTKLYEWGAFIAHNPDGIPGLGSCIFLHLAPDNSRPTAVPQPAAPRSARRICRPCCAGSTPPATPCWCRASKSGNSSPGKHVVLSLPTMMKALLFLFAAALTLPASDAVRIEHDIDYLGPDRAEKADLYLPSNASPGQKFPAIVIIHGGGWAGGDKGAAREINIGTTLALNGYVGMSINYLLSKSHPGPTWPQNLHDCKTAVRWLRANAERLNIDPERIGAIGGSAGGHLATMLAITGPELDPPGEGSCRIQCAVNLYGPVLWFEQRDISMFRQTREQAPELYRQASPLTHIDKDDPPILILHGTADKTVAVADSEALAAALKTAGVEHHLEIIPDAPHTFHLQPKQRDLRPLVLGFFDKHLKAN